MQQLPPRKRDDQPFPLCLHHCLNHSAYNSLVVQQLPPCRASHSPTVISLVAAGGWAEDQKDDGWAAEMRQLLVVVAAAAAMWRRRQCGGSGGCGGGCGGGGGGGCSGGIANASNAVAVALLKEELAGL